uniref:hypothetical protein n=1 Tax=Streptomyces asoensis TaxID=249586 RepID=UPI00209C1F1E|nr:hypothetical protein [Streptomyces asoensis]
MTDILTAVYATVPPTTAGDPWHRSAQSRVSAGRGRHAARIGRPDTWSTPATRWQRGSQHTEIRSVAEHFDGPEGADHAIARQAFIELWKALHER